MIWFRALGRVVRTAFAADPTRAAVVFVVLPLMGLSQVLSAWYLKMLIDGIVHGDSGAAGMAIVAVATLIVTGHVVVVVLSKVRFTLQERTSLHFERELLRSWTGPLVRGDPAAVRAGLEDLVASTGADELMITTMVHSSEDRLRSYELVAEACGLTV